MVVKVSLLSGAVASDGVLSIQTNGTTEAISISTGQVATFVNNPILTGGTANGVAYLNGSKVLTTGTALVFDGATLTNNAGSTATALSLNSTNGTYGLDVGLKYNGTSIGSIGSSKGIDSTGALTDLGINSASNLDFATGYTRRMRLDSAGNLGLGVTPSGWYSGYKALQVGTSNPAGFWSGGYDVVVGSNIFQDGNGTYKQIGASYRGAIYKQFDSAHSWYTTTNVGANTSVTPTQAMTLDASGNLLVGTPSGTNAVTSYASGKLTFYGRILNVTGDGFQIAQFAGDAGSDPHQFYAANTSGSGNAAATMYKLGKASTGRSINAAGTINAAGLDYAEYMTKAGDFAVAKGDVVGINAEGKLTNVFADAVSFVVKSTSPSYVGGDTWGTPEALGLTKLADDATQEEKDAFNAALEVARQKVDRIAFAGQVPVNVTGATAGQYIVPVNENGAIKGQAVSNPTFEQYQQAVGKVIAIEEDGRARIIVKVA